MRVALDTNRYLNLCRGVAETVDVLEQAAVVLLPFVVLGELRAGFVHGRRQVENERVLRRFLLKPGVSVLFADDQTTHHYAEVFRQLRKQGTPIPTNDIWLAALVLQHNLALHARDRHFDHLPQIARVWSRPGPISMPRYVAFLRAVNVGGRIVKMDELRGHFAAAGFTGVESFIASGNVIFDTKAKPGAALEARIEGVLKRALGYEVPTFVRSLEDVVVAARRQPFPQRAVAAAGAYAVGMLKAPVDPAAQKRLDALDPSQHTFAIHGSEVYWLCKVKQSETRLTPVQIERALGGPTTMRAMTSIRKLAAKHCAGG